MTSRADLRAFINARRHGVIATNSGYGAPESALVGLAASMALELVFDTTEATRKIANLRRDPNISVVIGWGEDGTLQYEGVADEPSGSELARIQQVYFEAFPDGRERLKWTGVTYVRIKPSWIRFTSFTEPASNLEVVF
jgi:Pyridoxamine 5'-phosphate oxidase